VNLRPTSLVEENLSGGNGGGPRRQQASENTQVAKTKN